MDLNDVPRAEVQPYDACSEQEQARSEDGSYLESPWRPTKLSWDKAEYDNLRTSIASHNPIVTKAKNYNILLVGQIGSGKSSFINTIFSAMRNELGQLAFNAEDDKSTTTKLRSYKLRESVQRRAVNVTLWDTMGFEGSYGPSIRDIDYMMDGHIRDGYKFKPNDSISFKDPHFNPDPKPEDKMHVLAMVVDALPMSTMDTEIMDKLREITRKANEKEIRWCVVMTKIDNACALVYNDITTVFSSAEIENCVAVIHETFGCIQSNIFPLQNYASMESINLPINILALHTLENILRLADNSMESSQGACMKSDLPEVPVQDLLKDPWRRSNKLTKEGSAELLKELVESKPKRVETLNLCLLGPIGAGKSSFINSVLTTLYGRVMTNAETGRMDHPVTSHYREYKLRQGRDGDELRIKLLDTMGLMTNQGGILTEDITTILDGKVDNVAPLNPVAPLQSTGKPFTLKTRVHAVVLVLNACTFSTYDDGMIEKMKAAMSVAKGQPREIPRIVLLTQIDELCPHVKEDVSTVFHSQSVQQVTQEVHEKLQVPLVDIWPVCNYSNDFDVDPKKSSLILLVLHHIVQRAQDYIDNAPIEEWEKPQGFLKRLLHWFGW